MPGHVAPEVKMVFAVRCSNSLHSPSTARLHSNGRAVELAEGGETRAEDRRRGGRVHVFDAQAPGAEVEAVDHQHDEAAACELFGVGPAVGAVTKFGQKRRLVRTTTESFHDPKRSGRYGNEWR